MQPYETPAPIIGALGGNFLSRFRVDIDYPDQLLFLEQSIKNETDDFDTLGLVLATNSTDQLVVRAVSSTASLVTRRNVLPGDVILGITGSVRVPQTLAEAAKAMSRTPGQRKQLRILRGGKVMAVISDDRDGQGWSRSGKAWIRMYSSVGSAASEAVIGVTPPGDEPNWRAFGR